jgi:hypothetical protein
MPTPRRVTTGLALAALAELVLAAVALADPTWRPCRARGWRARSRSAAWASSAASRR